MKASVISCQIALFILIAVVNGISCKLQLPHDSSEEKEIVHNLIGRPMNRMRPKTPIPNRRPGSIPVADMDGMMNYLGKMEKGNCMLENEMVSITDQLPEKDKSAYFPTCVKVQRCKGCCMGNRDCMATNFSTKSFQINRTDNSKPVTVHVIEHTGCSCNCKIDKQICPDSIGAKFDPMECTCMCQNRDEEKKCHEMPSTHRWVAASCSCKCKQKRECSTGEIFDEKSCKCKNENVVVIPESEWAVYVRIPPYNK